MSHMRRSLQNIPDLNEAQIAQKKSLQRFSAVLFAVSVSISLLFHPFCPFCDANLVRGEWMCLSPSADQVDCCSEVNVWLRGCLMWKRRWRPLKCHKLAEWAAPEQAGIHKRHRGDCERASERVGWCAGEWWRGQMRSLIGFVKGRLVKVQTEMVWFKCLHYILFYKAKWCWRCLINNKRSRLVHYNVEKVEMSEKWLFLN